METFTKHAFIKHAFKNDALVPRITLFTTAFLKDTLVIDALSITVYDAFTFETLAFMKHTFKNDAIAPSITFKKTVQVSVTVLLMLLK